MDLDLGSGAMQWLEEESENPDPVIESDLDDLDVETSEEELGPLRLASLRCDLPSLAQQLPYQMPRPRAYFDIEKFLELPFEQLRQIYSSLWNRRVWAYYRPTANPGYTMINTFNIRDLWVLPPPRKPSLARSERQLIEINNSEIAMLAQHSAENAALSRDILQYMRKMDLLVYISRPREAKGINYGVCDPIFEEMPFIKKVGDWLASTAPRLAQPSVKIEHKITPYDGSYLSMSEDWMLEQLAPWKRRFPMLRLIAIEDQYNYAGRDGFCWTVKGKDGAWTKLKKLAEGSERARREDFIADVHEIGFRLS